MSYKPADTRIGGFTTQRFDTGVATDADSTPTVTVTRNGSDQGGVSVTVTKSDTGRYKYSYTIDAGWAAGDRIQEFAAATVNSVVGKAILGDFVLDKRVDDALDANNRIDLGRILGSAVSASSAQLGVNAVNWAGSAVTKNAANIPEVDAKAISGSTTAADSVEANMANLDAAVSTRSSHTAPDVWAATTRTLSSFGTLAADVWANSTRTLTSFGTLVSDVATAVWGASTRTLTSFGTLVSDVATAVWEATTRTLSTFGSLTSDCATAVWGATSRTLSSFGSLIGDIWAYLLTGITMDGSVGKLLKDDVNAAISSRSSHTAADVKTALEAEGSILDWLSDVGEGDIFIDTTATPWRLEIRVKGTETALITKELRQVDGTAVTSASHLVARHTEPAP
jgi:hypothetical protein